MDLPDFVLHIVRRLQEHGHTALVVGGAVRDLCMERTVTDWDVATSATPTEITTIFKSIRHFSLKHETVTLVHDGRRYEVTTFRGEDKRDVAADLAHRDFTINAMAYDPARREILDPFGGGKDIRRKLVRCVGKPGDRFREDPLRLLRSARLAAELGFRMEPGTLHVVSVMAKEIHRAARERIRDEILRVLLSPIPSRGFRLMRRTGLLREVLPELLEGVGRRQNPRYHRYTIYRHIMETMDRVEAEPVLRLTALLHDIAKPKVREKVAGRFRSPGHEKEGALLAREILGRLRFSNGIIERVTHLILNHMADMDYHPGWSDGAVRRLIRRIGPEQMDDFLSFRKADLCAHGTLDKRQALFLELEHRVRDLISRPFAVQSRQLAIDGHQVMRTMHLGPGPEVGRILDLLMDRVTDAPELNCEESLLTILKELKTE